MLLTIKTDEKTDRMIGRIKRDFGICCTAGALRKGLALLALANEVKISGKDLAIVDANVHGVQRIEI